jgi:(R,R)-butanediol dehydrogenase/meso-butanediol dehydrogenase/diacetyl reductase
MRALRYHGRMDVRLEEIDPPLPPGPTQVQLVPAWSGICGTDIHEYVAGPIIIPVSPHPLSGATLPMTLGHEATGVVAAIGSEVTTHKPGDRVRKSLF